jgi:peptidoglycan lytic transglycosylase
MLLKTMLVIATFYSGSSPGEGGRLTANGERYNSAAFTAAHRTLPFGTILHVCRSIRCVSVRINDRGPFIKGRKIDLSYAAAKALNIVHLGKARVTVAAPLPRPRPMLIQEAAAK